MSTEGEESGDEKCCVPCLSPMTGEMPCRVSFSASQSLAKQVRNVQVFEKKRLKVKTLLVSDGARSVWNAVELPVVERDSVQCLMYFSRPVSLHR